MPHSPRQLTGTTWAASSPAAVTAWRRALSTARAPSRVQQPPAQASRRSAGGACRSRARQAGQSRAISGPPQVRTAGVVGRPQWVQAKGSASQGAAPGAAAVAGAPAAPTGRRSTTGATRVSCRTRPAWGTRKRGPSTGAARRLWKGDPMWAAYPVA
jgi:hypothetical protein